MTTVAFDPGLSGACSVIAPDHVNVMPMPTVGDAKKRTVNVPEVAAWLRELKPNLVVLEHAGPRPGESVTSAHKNGAGWGDLRGCVLTLGIRLEVVAPQTWKREFGIKAPSVEKLAKGASDDEKKAHARAKAAAQKVAKGMACEIAMRLFPMVSLVPPRCRVPHDGMAESLLIAEFGVRRFGR